jgi:hypothetical protein
MNGKGFNHKRPEGGTMDTKSKTPGDLCVKSLRPLWLIFLSHKGALWKLLVAGRWLI